jgi:hypothetical protein
MLLSKLLLVALCFAPDAVHAEPRGGDAYESLTAVPLAPSQAPSFVNGVGYLSGSENRHHEHLPLQLEGALKKVKKAKYHPSGLSRDAAVDF